jgi:hypothetical protein
MESAGQRIIVPESGGENRFSPVTQSMYRFAPLGVPQASPRGLYDRLNSDRSGRRSGDQFCVYVCDRLVQPALDRSEIEAIASAEASLDQTTRAYIQEHLSYRFVELSTFAESLAIERSVRSGVLSVGAPLLNPLSTAQ